MIQSRERDWTFSFTKRVGGKLVTLGEYTVRAATKARAMQMAKQWHELKMNPKPFEMQEDNDGCKEPFNHNLVR